MQNRIGQIILGLLVVVLFTWHIRSNINIGLVDILENFAYDTRVKLTTKKGKDSRIVIVDVDEQTLREMGQWSWPRNKIKLLVDKLFDQYNIAVLGFDMVFAERHANSGREKYSNLQIPSKMPH